MSKLTKIYLGLWLAWFLCFSFDFLQTLQGFIFFGIILLTGYYAARLIRKLIRKLLWRIRRKLIISYIFIGFVPLLLLAVLVLLGSFIFLGQSTSETFHAALDASVLRVRVEAEKLLNLGGSIPQDQVASKWLEGLSMDDQKWLRQAEIRFLTPEGEQVLQGAELLPLPEWLHKKDWSGLVIRGNIVYVTIVTFDTTGERALIIQVPINNELLERMMGDLRADIEYFALGDTSAKNEFQKVFGPTRRQPIWPVWWDFPIAWLSFPDQYDWQTGDQRTVFDKDDEDDYQVNLGSAPTPEKSGFSVHSTGKRSAGNSPQGPVGAFLVTTTVSRVTGHIFERSSTLQKIAYGIMIGVALCFLGIELISLASGFFLAKSITSSIHELFEGTARIRSGDLNYRIRVRSKDQLGELGVSFNQMTTSIQELLTHRAEKERLAESLHIARQLQEKLLPGNVGSLAGIDMATLNLAAEEVCGDYYDIIRNGEHQMGIIIADVSGKGPGAALYMAEVKGVILSVTRRTLSPREVLMEANEILAPTLDSRNFITMTFAMVDDSARIIRVARAGHNPLLHYSSATGTIEVLQPQGVGLGIGGRNGIFDKTLLEEERKLNPGDIVVFYTDGLTEAMNSSRELYGLDRLSALILRTKDLTTDQIKASILQDLTHFLNQGPPQDDITLVLLKVR